MIFKYKVGVEIVKIIHTADWHIGKIVNEFSQIEDQKYILDQLVEILKEEKPHALVIAGDLYDRSVPPAVAVELLDEYISKISVELKIPVLAIGGNHDSAERLSFVSEILSKNNFYIEGILKKDPRKVILSDEFGPVNFYMVPYADPAIVRRMFENPEIKTHDDAMKMIIDNIEEKMNGEERNVMITHGYVTSSSKEMETSESERPLSIGGTDRISSKYFDIFNYTALGHLHSAQPVGSDKIGYSGSLLKYSFSEVKHKKGVTIVNIDGEGNLDIGFKQLIPLRNMKIIKGELKELITPEEYNKHNTEDYFQVNLTDKGEVIDAISQLRAVYKNIMLLKRDYQIEDICEGISGGRDYEQKNKVELFGEFFEMVRGRELNEEETDIVSNVLEQVEKEEDK